MALFQIFFFFNDTATTEIYTLSLHDALPICLAKQVGAQGTELHPPAVGVGAGRVALVDEAEEKGEGFVRSEEHTSELQSRQYLVCRLLLEKKKNIQLPTK